MEYKNSKLKNIAKKILEKHSIFTLSDEKEIIEKLIEIEECKDDNINDDMNYKIIENIQIYLNLKEKMRIVNEDYDFISELASSLRKQHTRKGENSNNNVVLFKITDNNGKEEFCLTRRSLEKYNDINKDNNKKITGILKTDSIELAELLEIIKRNF